jgi:hypothetical protein
VVGNVSLAQAGNEEVVLPARVQEALGQLVGSAKEGLLALSVGVGLGVLAELLEEEVVEVVGAKGRHDPERSALRHGHEAGEVTLGGRRIAVRRPRVRSADGAVEVRLRTDEHFAERDPLSRVLLERMLTVVSTRRYRRTQEPVGSEVEARERSTSKSSVSRTLIERTRRSLGELMGRRLDDVRLAVMMINGLELQGGINVVVLGITTEGVKVPLGLWEGSSENATVATALLADLVERGLDPVQGILFVIEGAKAPRTQLRTLSSSGCWLGRRAGVGRDVLVWLMALRRAHADEYAVRVNRAVVLLGRRSPAEAVRALQAEHRLSERQARRDVRAALDWPEGVLVPERTGVFTVRLPLSLIAGLRGHARSHQRTLSARTADAVRA